MARFTPSLLKSMLLCTAAAFGFATALPARADQPCMPFFDSKWQMLAKIPSDADNLGAGVGDFDDDGWSDLIVFRMKWQTPKAMEIAVLLNDPDQGMRDATKELFVGPIPKAVHIRAFILEDFNGDGRLDAYLADQGMDRPPWPMAQNVLILSTNDGKLRDATDQLPQGLDFTHGAAAADIDGDGDIDIWAGNDFVGPPPYFLINDGNGVFTEDSGRVPSRITDMSFNWFSAAILADVNGDHSPDLVLGQGHHDRRWSYVLMNDGTGHFTPLDTPLPFPPFSPHDVTIGFAAADLDGDRQLDLLKYHATNEWDNRGDIQLLFGNGDGTFRDETDARLEQNRRGSWSRWASFLDLNDDGHLDIAATPWEDPQLFYINDGENHFVQWIPPFYIDTPVMIDVNRDGKLDLMTFARDWERGGPETYIYHRYLGCR